MAARDTLNEANELRDQIAARHPSRTIAVRDLGEGRRWDRYAVVEIRRCACGAEVATHAIGEGEGGECTACKAAREARRGVEREQRQREVCAQREHADFHDLVLNQ